MMKLRKQDKTKNLDKKICEKILHQKIKEFKKKLSKRKEKIDKETKFQKIKETFFFF